MFVLFYVPILVTAVKFDGGYFTSLITGGLTVIRNLIVFLVSLAVVWFIWNVVKYAMSDEEDGKTKAKSQMIHGIIAIAVIVSIWALVYMLQDMFLGGKTLNSPTYLDRLIPGGDNNYMLQLDENQGNANAPFEG